MGLDEQIAEITRDVRSYVDTVARTYAEHYRAVPAALKDVTAEAILASIEERIRLIESELHLAKAGLAEFRRRRGILAPTVPSVAIVHLRRPGLLRRFWSRVRGPR